MKSTFHVGIVCRSSPLCAGDTIDFYLHLSNMETVYHYSVRGSEVTIHDKRLCTFLYHYYLLLNPSLPHSLNSLPLSFIKQFSSIKSTGTPIYIYWEIEVMSNFNLRREFNKIQNRFKEGTFINLLRIFTISYKVRTT